MADTAAGSVLMQTELDEITRRTTAGSIPVVFVHVLWLLSNSWQRWRELFERNGYTTIEPGCRTTRQGRRRSQTTSRCLRAQDGAAGHRSPPGRDHPADRQTAVIGHSFGGLIAQKIAGDGVAAATVAIDNAPFRGVLPLPVSALKSAAPVLAHPSSRNKAIALTFEIRVQMGEQTQRRGSPRPV